MKKTSAILYLRMNETHLYSVVKMLFIVLVFSYHTVVSAQIGTEVLPSADNGTAVCDTEMSPQVHDEVNTSSYFHPYEYDYMPSHCDSLALPRLNMYGQTTINAYPLYWAGCTDWSLHKGLNINLGASVFAAFGSHSRYKGAGFSQNISMMYAIPVTNKLSIALGGYFTNTSWSHDSYRDAGLNAVLGYKFDEHWEAYLFGQKSLVNKRMPLSLYDVNGLGDRIGAAVKYNFSPSFSIQVSVSASKYNLPSYNEPDVLPVTVPGNMK